MTTPNPIFPPPPPPPPPPASTVPINIGLSGPIQAGGAFTCKFTAPTGQYLQGTLQVYFASFVLGAPYNYTLIPIPVPSGNPASLQFSVPSTLILPTNGLLVVFVTDTINSVLNYAGVSSYYTLPSYVPPFPVLAYECPKVDVIVLDADEIIVLSDE